MFVNLKKISLKIESWRVPNNKPSIYMLTLESLCILDVLISKTLPSCKSTTRGYSYQVYFKEQKLLKLQTHHNSWQSCVSCELRLIIYLGAFTILSVHKLKFKGVCFCSKQEELYCCDMSHNATISLSWPILGWGQFNNTLHILVL